jgi:YggT family protein
MGRTARPAGEAGCAPTPAPASVPQLCGGDRVITILFEIVDKLLDLYKWVVIIAAVFSTLIAFGVLDTRNRVVWTIGDFLYRITEPALRRIRNFLPSFGSLDISPIILIILIYVAQMVLARLYGAIVYGNIQGLLL